VKSKKEVFPKGKASIQALLKDSKPKVGLLKTSQSKILEIKDKKIFTLKNNVNVLDVISNLKKDRLSLDTAKNLSYCRLDSKKNPRFFYVPREYESCEELCYLLAGLLAKRKIQLAFVKFKGSHKITDFPEATEKFLQGMVVSVLDDASYLPNLKTNKTPVERGRLLLFTLRLKNWVSRRKILDSEILKKTNAFFGNNSGEVKSNLKVSYVLKTWVNPIFEDKKAAEVFWRALITCVNLNNLSYDKSFEKVSRKYFRSISEITSRFSRVSKFGDARRKKRNAQERHLPKLPASSPLFLKSEIKFIKKFIRSLWTREPVLAQGWDPILKHFGTFSDVEEYLKELYLRRWHLIEAISRVTTSRLRAAKKAALIKDKDKKRDVTEKVVISVLIKRGLKLGEILSDELESIIKNHTKDFNKFLEKFLLAYYGWSSDSPRQSFHAVLRDFYRKTEHKQFSEILQKMQLLDEKHLFSE
jgi:hypothetical protein